MSAAAKFFTSIAKHRLLSAREILLQDFSKCNAAFKDYTTPDFASINDSLFRFIETAPYEEKDKKKVAKNLSAYFAYLASENLREAQAHFANLYSSSNYPQSLVFIVTECADLYAKITDFIKSL